MSRVKGEQKHVMRPSLLLIAAIIAPLANLLKLSARL
jgi:hypothetical protein